MGSELEERLRELLAANLSSEDGAASRRVELSGVTIMELRIEKLVVVEDGAQEKT